jgi:hypothetical protein
MLAKRKKKSSKKVQYFLFPIEKVRGLLPKLQTADIILIHTKKSFLRYLIRRVTQSYWDHVALVLFPRDLEKGRYYNQIVEAADPGGVEIHKLDKYLKNPEKYDIGIKRITSVSTDTRKRITAFMLMNVDAPYYKLSLARFMLASLWKNFSENLLGRQRFCCSGFVQRAFYEAANWDEREKLIFRTEYLSPMELQDITTPGDIAKSTKAVWMYNKNI